MATQLRFFEALAGVRRGWHAFQAMKIAIIGVGAMGSAYAGLLASRGTRGAGRRYLGRARRGNPRMACARRRVGRSDRPGACHAASYTRAYGPVIIATKACT